MAADHEDARRTALAMVRHATAGDKESLQLLLTMNLRPNGLSADVTGALLGIAKMLVEDSAGRHGVKAAEMLDRLLIELGR